jgi:hypothetical protein
VRSQLHAFRFTNGKRTRGGLAPRTDPNGSEKIKISVGNRTTILQLSIRSLATKRSRLPSPAITQNCIELLKVTSFIHSFSILSDDRSKASSIKRKIPYILESNPHPFYSFRGLKNQMRIRFAVESWILEKL